MPASTSTENLTERLKALLQERVEHLCDEINLANETARSIMMLNGLPPEDVFKLVQQKTALDKIMATDPAFPSPEHFTAGLPCSRNSVRR